MLQFNIFTASLAIPSLLSAIMCDISSAYFRRLFNQAYGISPVKYINQLKISRAKELLSFGMYTVTQATEMSGYTDMSHFSREFNKATGQPRPPCYRNRPEKHLKPRWEHLMNWFPP